MKYLLTLTFIMVIFYSASGQNFKDTAYKNQSKKYFYAYVTIQGKAFSKKLKVYVDLGDTPGQVEMGKEYSEILTNKKSYAAVLNFLAENEYELVESRDNNYSFQDSGGTSGIILIMRKKR